MTKTMDMVELCWQFVMNLHAKYTLPTNFNTVACELTINDNDKLILSAFYRLPTSKLMYLENLCPFFSDLV